MRVWINPQAWDTSIDSNNLIENIAENPDLKQEKIWK